MTAEPPASDATPSRRRRIARRVLTVCAFVVIGYVAVWQGFGVLGFGTEDHPWRNAATWAVLLAGGLVLAWPRPGVPVRATAAALALVLAAVAWWLVPCRDGGLSLRDAVARRDQLRARLAADPSDDIESAVIAKIKVDELQSQYGYLGFSLRGEVHRLAAAAAVAVANRFRRLSPDDATAARALEEQARRLAIKFPEVGEHVGAAVDDWTGRALDRRTRELRDLAPADWAGFDRTAPARRALAEVGGPVFAIATRDALTRAEEDWVNDSVDALAERHAGAGGGDGPRAEVWKTAETDVLALETLDADDGRFKPARRRLFDLAFAAATAETNRLIKDGRPDDAFGVARRLAVDWSETAALLGSRDVKKLDALRDKCAALAEGHVPGTPVAPPPRPR